VIGEVARTLNERAEALGLRLLRPGLVVGIDADVAGKITMLLLDESGLVSAVVKVSRRRAYDRSLRAEYDALMSVHSRPLPHVGAAIPHAVLLDRIAARLVLVTTAVPGAPLTVRYYRPRHVQSEARVRADFAAVSNWLSAFQTDVPGRTVSCDEAWHTYGVPLFERYRQSIGWSDCEERLYARMERWVRDLADVKIPTTSVHGDYCIGNVLLDGDTVTGVVDWELGRQCGLATTDVFKFAASYGSFLDRAIPQHNDGLTGHPGWGDVRSRWGKRSTWTNLIGFIYAFFGSGWFPEIVRDYLAANYSRLDCSLEVQPLFLAMFVAEQVLILDNRAYRRGYRELLRVLSEFDDEQIRAHLAAT
jgi:phosphotransferase family enzyme